MQSWGNLLALAMIPAVVWIAWDVITHYFPKVHRPISMWKGEDYLIMGVMVSFGIAGCLNGVFWGLHFGATAFGWDGVREITYKLGQIANIVTLNIPYLAAGLLHLAAAYIYGVKGVKPPSWYIARSIVVTAVTFVLLYWGASL